MPIRLRLEDLGRLAGEMKARAAAERAQAEARRHEAAQLKTKAYIIIYGTNTPLGKLFDLVLLSSDLTC